MEILGSIQSENVVIEGREKMQKQMRDFIARLQKGQGWGVSQVSYKVHFWRPHFGAKVDSLIEFRAEGHEAWFARANGPEPWKAFCKAMACLKQIVTEIEMREGGANADDSGAA